MKQRITYVVKNPDSFTPELLKVGKEGAKASLTLKDVDAVKEHRITVGLDELPRELSTYLEQWHELHIRWASETPYATIPPFTSRVSPGLHVFFTPLHDTPEDALCQGLHSAFSPDLKCSSMSETAVKLPILSKRFAMSASSQYYSHLPSLSTFVQGLEKQVCSNSKLLGPQCTAFVSSLQSADYLDMDYDIISRALILTSFWSSAPTPSGWTETIAQPSADSRVEIGVLTSEPNPDPEDIQFGGFLTVLGESNAPKATRFQTPTRHYPLSPPSPQNLTFTTTLQHPTGLHPTLILTLPTSLLTPPSPHCTLHAHLTLPSALFIDAHQLKDPLFLLSKNLLALRSQAGATDLEAPDWVIPQWGSTALFQLASPDEDHENQDATWNFSFPLHTRYLPASASSPHTLVPLPWPALFWACSSDAGHEAMRGNPFDRLNLGYEAFFGQGTRFVHIQPRYDGVQDSGSKSSGGGGTEGGLVEYISIPVLDLRSAAWVQSGTVGVVLVAFLGLCWVLGRRVGSRSPGANPSPGPSANSGEGRDGKKEGKKRQ